MLIIIDRLEGHGIHKVEIILHLHPDVRPFLKNVHDVEIQNISGNRLGIIRYDKNLQVALTDSTYHPEFGLSLKNNKVIGTWEGEIPVSFKQTITIS